MTTAPMGSITRDLIGTDGWNKLPMAVSRYRLSVGRNETLKKIVGTLVDKEKKTHATLSLHDIRVMAKDGTTINYTLGEVVSDKVLFANAMTSILNSHKGRPHLTNPVDVTTVKYVAFFRREKDE